MFVLAILAFVIGEVTPIHFTLISLFFGIVGLKLGLFEQAELEKQVVHFNSCYYHADCHRFYGRYHTTRFMASPTSYLTYFINRYDRYFNRRSSCCKIDWLALYKGTSSCVNCIVWFPGDYMLCEEVSRSLTKTKRT